MKLQITTVGKKHDEEIAGAIAEFSSRIGRYLSLEWKMIPQGTIQDESNAILKSLDEKDHVIVLDEKGKELSSVEFARSFERMLNESVQKAVFVIGGAYGVSEALKERADFIMSLSKLTFPHQLVRLILAEQIYRALSIIKGEKYHHA